jgi:hypothetical protein
MEDNFSWGGVVSGLLGSKFFAFLNPPPPPPTAAHHRNLIIMDRLHLIVQDFAAKRIFWRSLMPSVLPVSIRKQINYGRIVPVYIAHL